MTRNRLLIALALLIIASGAVLFFSGGISFTAFLDHRQTILDLVHQRYGLAMLMFALIYIGVILTSLPATLVLSVVGGAVFGNVTASLLVLISVCIGASLVFLLVRGIFHDYFMERARGWLRTLHSAFHADAASYMLLLRLTPVIPFPVVNICAALLGTPFRIFFWTTALGVLPATIAYTTVGFGLNSVFDQEAARLLACRQSGAMGCTAQINPSSFLSLPMIAGLAALAGLVLLTLIARRYQARRAASRLQPAPRLDT